MHQFHKISLGIGLCAWTIQVLWGAVSTESYIAKVRSTLAPTPKHCTVIGPIKLQPPYFINESQMELPAGAAKLLRDDFKKLYGWSNAQTNDGSQAGFVINVVSTKLNDNPEAYELTITPGRIFIGAETPQGVWLGVNRLRAIISGVMTKALENGTLECPRLYIKDWPDYPIRIQHFNMAGQTKFRQRIPKMIDFCAKLGVNYVSLSIGGRFESKKYPQFCYRPWWTQREIKDFVAYAKARGIIAIPEIGGPAHLSTSFKIYPVESKVKGTHRKVPVIQDFTHPDFYSIRNELVNELLDLFDNPPYLHGRGDECYRGLPILAQRTGRSEAELYAEYFNNLNQVLAKRGTRLVIYHDMLVSGKSKHGEPLNGQCTYKALQLLNPNIIIDVWIYTALNRYQGLEAIAASGREFWVTSWRGRQCISRLYSEGKRLGAKGAKSTDWWNGTFQFIESVVFSAEYSWNTPKAVPPAPGLPHDIAPPVQFSSPDLAYNALQFINTHLLGRGIKTWTKTDNLGVRTFGGVRPSVAFMKQFRNRFPSMVVDALGLQVKITDLRSFGQPDAFVPEPMANDVKKLRRLAKAKELFVVDLSQPYLGCYQVDEINQPRKQGKLVIYTPAYGNTTRSNRWGRDWQVVNDKVFSHPQTNALIPYNGWVLSAHFRNYRAFEQLRLNDQLGLFRVNPKVKLPNPIKIDLSAMKKRDRIILFLTAENSIFGAAHIWSTAKPPVHKLARITTTFADGSTSEQNVDTLSFCWRRNHNPKRWLAWQDPLQKLNPILAIELNTGSKQAVEITIVPETYGVYAALTVLSVCAL